MYDTISLHTVRHFNVKKGIFSFFSVCRCLPVIVFINTALAHKNKLCKNESLSSIFRLFLNFRLSVYVQLVFRVVEIGLVVVKKTTYNPKIGSRCSPAAS